MEELDNVIPEDQPLNIEEMFAQSLPKIKLPSMTMKNLSATAAMLSNEPTISGYGGLVERANQGDFSEHKRLIDNSSQKIKQYDQQTILSLLGDPSVSFEEKQKAVDNIPKSKFLYDTSMTLLHNSAAKESPGENFEQETVRVRGVGEQIASIYSSIEKVQGLKNAHAASLQDRSDLAIGIEAAEAWVVPFANNLITGRINQKLAEATGKKLSPFDVLKGYVAAGSTMEDIRTQLATLPVDKRSEFTQSLLKTIAENNSITFSGYNQFVQVEKAQQLLEEGGYTNTEKWLDNLSPLLDVVGIGQAVRGGGKVTKAAGKVEGALASLPPAVTAQLEKDQATAAVKTERLITEADLTKAPVPDKIPRGNLAEIEALQAQRADLLGQANELDPGQVNAIRSELEAMQAPVNEVKARAKELQKSERLSHKDALKKAQSEYDNSFADYQATKGRLERQLEINASGNKVNQELADLDKRIAELERTAKELVTPKLNPIVDLMKRIEWNSVVRNENPAAPGNIMGMANPSVARGFHKALLQGQSEEAANALFSASRSEALANNVMPQAITQNGAVTAKVMDIERDIRQFVAPEESVAKFMAENGNNGMSLAEKAAVRAKVVNDFQNASGLHVNDAMGGLKFDDNGNVLSLNAVYGTSEGGFSNAEQAWRQAQYALRNYGVKPSDIEVLSRQGLDYVPVDLAAVIGKEGDYLVRVNVEYTPDVKDVAAWDKLDVVKNWFDHVPGTVSNTVGSITRHIFDASSVLNPTITSAAINASDFSARLERILLDSASEFADSFVKLPKDRQALLNKYFLEANFQQIRFDYADLTARGFSSAEIDVVKTWRKHWDNMFYLENLDVVRTLNNQGVGLLKTPNVELFLKPIAKNGNIRDIYNPATDTIVSLSKQELDDLYNAGGTLAVAKRPVTINGQSVEHVMVRNTPNEYIRKLRDSDRVLNYRHGYFQLQYTAPKFVDEITATGKRAIAVAGDTPEAEAFAERMRTANPGVEYKVRDDKRMMQTGGDDWFDVNSASGRIAQRHRGQLLEDANGLNHLGDKSYILNPADSAIRASRSIAGRTMSRQMLETAKARAIAQYGEFFPSNGMGGVRWPRSIDEINQSAKGQLTAKEVADARTTWEYVNYLENGYINAIDDFSKAMFNTLGTVAGKAGLGKTERALYGAGQVNIASTAKSGVFWAYIATNFLRQWIVQPHQIVRSIGYNLEGWLKGAPLKYTTTYVNNKVLGVKGDQNFIDFVDNSGLLDAVDKHNLIRGTLADMANNASLGRRVATRVIEAPRKIGFDVGEQSNMLMHAAIVYDKFQRAGKNLKNIDVRNQAYSEIRAITYDMNFAGDMPYNQNAMGVLLQFMQVPHKAVLQLTNRRLSMQTRMQLFTTDIALFGLPVAAISQIMGGDILPEDDNLRQLVTDGAESWMLNRIITDLFPEYDEQGNKIESRIDFSGLAPYDLDGWGKLFVALVTNPTQILMNSPSGQLYLKEGGRVQNAMAAMSRYFGAADHSELTPETFTSMLYEVARISSGFNNYHKAKVMMELDKAIDARGNTIDDAVTHREAIAQILGFGPSDVKQYYEASMSESEKSKAYKEEVLSSYNAIRTYYLNQLEAGNTDPYFITSVSGTLMKMYEDKPLAKQIIVDQLEKDVADDKGNLLRLIMNRTGYVKEGPMTIDQIRQLPYPEETKQILIERLENLKKLQGIPNE